MIGYKSTVAAAAIVASLGLGSAAMATELPSTMTVPPGSGVQDITAQLRDAGFTNISETKLSGSIYEAKAMYGGDEVHLRLDTATGGLTKTADASGNPMIIHAKDDTTDAQIKDSLASLGYSNFGDVKRSGDVVDVMADRHGERVNLRIEQSTGLVTEQGGDTMKTMSSDSMKSSGSMKSGSMKSGSMGHSGGMDQSSGMGHSGGMTQPGATPSTSNANPTQSGTGASKGETSTK